jgi:hypothetical protein
VGESVVVDRDAGTVTLDGDRYRVQTGTSSNGTPYLIVFHKNPKKDRIVGMAFRQPSGALTCVPASRRACWQFNQRVVLRRIALSLGGDRG